MFGFAFGRLGGVFWNTDTNRIGHENVFKGRISSGGFCLLAERKRQRVMSVSDGMSVSDATKLIRNGSLRRLFHYSCFRLRDSGNGEERAFGFQYTAISISVAGF